VTLCSSNAATGEEAGGGIAAHLWLHPKGWQHDGRRCCEPLLAGCCLECWGHSLPLLLLWLLLVLGAACMAGSGVQGMVPSGPTITALPTTVTRHRLPVGRMRAASRHSAVSGRCCGNTGCPQQHAAVVGHVRRLRPAAAGSVPTAPPWLLQRPSRPSAPHTFHTCSCCWRSQPWLLLLRKQGWAIQQGPTSSSSNPSRCCSCCCYAHRAPAPAPAAPPDTLGVHLLVIPTHPCHQTSSRCRPHHLHLFLVLLW
jgi:hypothetical protein